MVAGRSSGMVEPWASSSKALGRRQATALEYLHAARDVAEPLLIRYLRHQLPAIDAPKEIRHRAVREPGIHGTANRPQRRSASNRTR